MLFLTQSFGQLSCNSGWVLYGEKCYMLNTVGSTYWSDCYSYCTTKSYPGASMLCVESLDQNKWLAAKYDDEFIWIGYSDLPPYGKGQGTEQYGWVPGCSSTFTNWIDSPQQPDNSNNVEDCAMMYFESSTSFRTKWNDVGCNTQSIQCACQYTPVTASPSSTPTKVTSPSPTTFPSLGSTVVPSTSSPTSVTTALIPAIQLPTCPIGWTLHCTCEWTDKRDHRYQADSPVTTTDSSLSWDAAYNKFSVGSALS